MLSRRDILKAALATLAVSGVAGAAVSLQRSATYDRPLKVLDPAQAGTVKKLAEAVVPTEGTWPDVDVVGGVDDLLASLPEVVVAEVLMAMGLLESPLVGLVLDGRPRPFSQLSTAEAAVAFDDWGQSALEIRRTAFMALRGLVVSCFFADPRVYSHMGYPGPVTP